MPRASVMKRVMVIGLIAGLQGPAMLRAADAPKDDSPAAVIAAAEAAYGKGDYKTYAACFDAAGQKQANTGIVGRVASFGTPTLGEKRIVHRTSFGVPKLATCHPPDA